MAVVTMLNLLEAGLHFGHDAKLWNPKMEKYIYSKKEKSHIIDLNKTKEAIEDVYVILRDIAKDKDVLFVGTRKNASEPIKREAQKCGMYYINKRWLGGTLTNFKTIKSSIDKLNKYNAWEASGELANYSKKEASKILEERDKLEANLGGIKNMPGLPGVIVVIGVKEENIALKEARKLGIPIIGLVDTNCDPDLVDFVIPGNDDANRAVNLILTILSNAVIEARQGIVYQVEEEPVAEELPFEEAEKNTEELEEATKSDNE